MTTQSPLERTIRERTVDYLMGDKSLDEFKDWLVGATWGIDESADPDAARLAYEIKLELAEESGGFVDVVALREALRVLVSRAPTAGTSVEAAAARGYLEPGAP